jgi:hypothetical protein
MRRFQRLVLRAQGIFLGISGAAGLMLLDIRGIFFGAGPVHALLQGGEVSVGIGLLEAHGLAAILGANLVLARREPLPARSWHVTGLATALLLGICNLALWRIFVVSGMEVMGFVATGLHLLFAVLQAIAASTPRPARQGAMT